MLSRPRSAADIKRKASGPLPPRKRARLWGLLLAAVLLVGLPVPILLLRHLYTQPARMPYRPQFITFGDSITQKGFSSPSGWTAALAEAYQRRADVVNRGYSGYNTNWALQLLDKVFPPAGCSGVRLATVWFGANDAALPNRTR